MLTGYVIYCAKEFAKIDKFSFPPKKKGKLTLQRVKINGEPVHFRNENSDKATKFVNFTQKIERLEFKIRFEGHVRNGFLHATVKYTNGRVSYIPDSNTYLSNFGFVDDYTLTPLEKEFDTGVLQGNGPVDLLFDLVLRSRKETDENPVIARGFIDRLGGKNIYRYCSIPEDFLVDSIEIRVLEDPFFKSNYKRREVDCITLRPRRSNVA